MLYDMCCLLFFTPLFFSWSGIWICGVVHMRYCNIVAALNAIPMYSIQSYHIRFFLSLSEEPSSSSSNTNAIAAVF